MTELDWHELARCRETDPSLWFPVEGGGGAGKAAKAICAGCEVRTDCLAWALDHHVPFGIWGGLSADERLRLVRARRRRAS